MQLEPRLLHTEQQTLAPHQTDAEFLPPDKLQARRHPEHGSVTYVQHVQAGGLTISVGDPKKPECRFFGPDSWWEMPPIISFFLSFSLSLSLSLCSLQRSSIT